MYKKVVKVLLYSRSVSVSHLNVLKLYISRMKNYQDRLNTLKQTKQCPDNIQPNPNFDITCQVINVKKGLLSSARSNATPQNRNVFTDAINVINAIQIDCPNPIPISSTVPSTPVNSLGLRPVSPLPTRPTTSFALRPVSPLPTRPTTSFGLRPPS